MSKLKRQKTTKPDISTFERLERRTMLSITDANIFGTGGVAEPFQGFADAKVAVTASGDILDAAETYTPGVGNSPAIFDTKVSDLSSSGQIKWTATIQESTTYFNLYPEALAQLPDDDVVVAVLQDYGNSGDQFLYEFDSSGNQITSFAANFGHEAGGADAQSAITAILPRSDNSMLLFNENDGNYNLQPVAADGTLGTAWSAETFGNSYTDSGNFIPYLQSDGKILVAGILASGNKKYLALQRLDADGSLDNSFSNGGTELLSGTYVPVAVQEGSTDGIIVATNDTATGSAIIFGFRPNGMPDRSFGVSGICAPAPKVQLTTLQIINDVIYAAGTRYGQPYLFQLLSTDAFYSAVGSTEPLLDGDYTTLNAVTAEGDLLFADDTGLLQETNGYIGNYYDTNPPTVTLRRLSPIPANATTFAITATYIDHASYGANASGIDTQTLETGNIALKYGHNRTIYGRLTSYIDDSDGSEKAYYVFASPNGTWLSNPGTYTIKAAADEVTDNAGNGVPAKVLASFTVKRQASAAKPSAIPSMLSAPTVLQLPVNPWLTDAINPLE